MSKPWFRFHVKSLESPKVQMLPPVQFKTWVNLLCLARQTDGVLPPLAAVAFKLRLPEKEVAKHIAALREARLLDLTEAGLMPHDWDEMQYDSDVSTSRVKAFRDRKRNVSQAVSETARGGFMEHSDSESVSESVSVSEKRDSFSSHTVSGSSGLKGAGRLRSGSLQ